MEEWEVGAKRYMMSDMLIMIKIAENQGELVSKMRGSYEGGTEGEYQVKALPDKQRLSRILEAGDVSDKLLVVFIPDRKNGRYETGHIFLGKCNISQKENMTITFKILRSISSPMVTQNILSFSELDLDRDFDRNSYINVEYTKTLIAQLEELLIVKGQKASWSVCEFGEREEERHLSEYAQHNEHCRRAWNIRGEEGERSEFQRDRERIVNSKAFRRMVDKAQIFTASKGDHYRTRMTHTLEVAQIARSIANSLKLNIDLTEAIALGHDLGHTPFGHQGERTLNDIVNGKTDVLPKLGFEKENPYGGFKHNFQSLRVLSRLEEKYTEYPGLDVSCQVLEGVLKHTSHMRKDCSKCTESVCCHRCCDYAEFVGEEIVERLYLEYEFTTTLEGQAVALADEIAQRSHDIDDAFSSGLLTFEEFQDYLKLGKLKPLAQIVEKTYQKVGKEDGRILVNYQEMLTARIISDIIGYLVNDVIDHSRKKIASYSKNKFYMEEHRFDEKLVDFSGEGAVVCRLLEKLISKRAVNCLEVTRFDRNAEQIVKYLFKAYFDNPKLIHNGTLRRMYIDILQNTDDIIDLIKGDPVLVKAELHKIASYHYPSEMEEWGDEDYEYYEKRKVLIRNIVDFIAGMTDSYAMEEYRKLLVCDS